MPRPMKDSGVEWLGDIPAHWTLKKCKTILSANDGGIWGNDPVGDESDKIVIRSTEQTIDGKWNIKKPATRDLSSIDYKKYRIEKDDLLITKSSGSDLHIGKTTLADDYFIYHECYYSNFLQRIRCSGYSPKLLWYLFNSPIIRAQCVYLQNSTSGLGNINADIIGNLYIPVPPLEEQQRIATFLDGKCTRIDSVIEKTRASIEEYKKFKQSLITRAVTKGIQPARPMKDSGVEWIGDIPADWELCKLKYISRFMQTKYSREDGALNYIGLENIVSWSGTFIKTDSVYDLDQSLICEAGDILFGKLRPYLAKVYLNKSKQCCSGEFAVIRIDDSKCRPFFFYQLMSHGFIFTVDSSTYGTKMPRANADFIKNICVVVPPLEEQKEIAQYLDEKTTAIDLVIGKKNQMVTELERLKKSLIYEYATGKKKIAMQ